MLQTAKHVGFLVGMGASVWMVRSVMSVPVHPLVASRAQLVREQPALARVLSELVQFGAHDETEALLDVVDEMLRQLTTSTRAAHWHVARLNGEIVRQARRMCAMRTRCDDATFHGLVVANDETVPELEAVLDNMLHNALLM